MLPASEAACCYISERKSLAMTVQFVRPSAILIHGGAAGIAGSMQERHAAAVASRIIRP